MNILHLDSGRQLRGGQWQVLLLMQALSRRGHRQQLLARPGSPLLERARRAGFAAEPSRPGLASAFQRWLPCRSDSRARCRFAHGGRPAALAGTASGLAAGRLSSGTRMALALEIRPRCTLHRRVALRRASAALGRHPTGTHRGSPRWRFPARPDPARRAARGISPPLESPRRDLRRRDVDEPAREADPAATGGRRGSPANASPGRVQRYGRSLNSAQSLRRSQQHSLPPS